MASHPSIRVMNNEPPGCAFAHPVQSYHCSSIRKRSFFVVLVFSFVAETPPSSSVTAGGANGDRNAARGPATSPRADEDSTFAGEVVREVFAARTGRAATAAAFRRIRAAADPRATMPAAARPAGETATRMVKCRV